jgi:hypothetical protein
VKIRHDVGTGDFFNAESFWSPAQKASLEVVYHAWLAGAGSQALISAMRASPTYRHVEHLSLDYPTQVNPGVIKTLRDHSISHLKTFHGSAFLSDKLDVDEGNYPPCYFDVIVPSTPKNGPACDRWVRPEEWAPILDRLEQRNTFGLILNIPGGRSSVPTHPRIIDWTGRTSLPQAIEILKRAKGYIGVDSCLAILAAELFEDSDLMIRTNNPYVYRYPWLHYSPQTDFSFLYSRFDKPPHPSASYRGPIKGGKVVELRCNSMIDTRNFTSGDRVEVDGHRADEMLKSRQAVIE